MKGLKNWEVGTETQHRGTFPYFLYGFAEKDPCVKIFANLVRLINRVLFFYQIKDSCRFSQGIKFHCDVSNFLGRDFFAIERILLELRIFMFNIPVHKVVLLLIAGILESPLGCYKTEFRIFC